ncbi:MAG TPA: tetratricopeptide repeat protein, partial [Pirellulales bacterium]|nr:tetratricopeptide repeat protein [Pirellulales bacterium]
ERIDGAVMADDLSRATATLRQYLKLRPDDTEQRLRMVELVDRGAATRRQKEESLRLHTLAVGLAPDRLDLQRRRAQLSYELSYFAEAVHQADDILRAERDDAAALRVKALALAAQARLSGAIPSDEVAQLFEQALKQSPGDVELAVGLADTYRTQMPPRRDGDQLGRQEKASLADRVMKRLIEAAPRSTDAYLARYQYRRQHGLAGADDDLTRALDLDPSGTHASVRVAAGQKALAAGNPHEAVGYFREAIAANPRDERGYLGLGQSRDRAGDLPGARTAWQQGLKSSDPNSPALNFELARAALREGDTDEARLPLERLEKEIRRRAGRMSPDLQQQWLDHTAILRAEWCLAHGDFAHAAELFEDLANQSHRAAPGLAGDQRGTRMRARTGAAFGRLGQWDRAVIEHEKAVESAPGDPDRRLELADAYGRAGRPDDAVAQYQQLLALDEPPAAVWTLAARALLERQLGMPTDRRQWREFDQVVERGRRAAPNDTEWSLLAAERAFAEGPSDEPAAALVHAATESRDASFCEKACAVLQRWRRFDEADRCLLLAAESGLPPRRQALLAADLQLARGKLDEAERVLRSAVGQAFQPDTTPRGDRLTSESPNDEIGLRLALVLLAQGRANEAKQELESLHRLDAKNPRLVQLLAELAWEQQDLESLEVNERRLQELEGPEGTVWRFFRGLRLSAGSPEPDDARLATAVKLQAEIEQARPQWPAAYLLKGRLAEVRNQPDEAIAAYSTALRLGERRPQIYGYLATRLYQLGRYAEAHALLDELKSRQPLSMGLTGLDLALDVRAGNLDSAVDAARRQATNRPDDPTALVWLGQILDLRGSHDEAASVLRRGIESAPTDARAWVALLQHHISGKQIELARHTFDEMQTRAELSTREGPFVIAQCHELLGDREAAAVAYRQALEAAPDEPAVWQRAARFYLASDRRQAEACLRRVLELRPKTALARRMLAALVVGAQGDQSLGDAAELLDVAGLSHADQIVNQRLGARLLLRHGDAEQRREAQQLLEQLVQHEKSPTTSDRLLLAQWYERDGRLQAAKDQLLALVLVDRPRGDDLARLIDFLLRHGRSDEAQEWLDQLSRAEPETEAFRTLSLRVAWWKQRGETPRIEAAIDEFVKRQPESEQTPSEQAALWTGIAGLYDAAGLAERAEACYRRAAERHAAGRCAFARWLAANERVAEAIQTCLIDAADDRTPQTAITLATVLAKHAGTAHAAEAEQFLAESLRRHPDSAMLLVSLATLRMMQGDSPQAREWFEQALRLQPENVVALNNLAMLLADDPAQYEQALVCLDRAIARTGRHPELLDSKGWLLLQADDASRAEELFREAVSLAPADPRPSFHLALACWAQGKMQEARAAFERARRAKLSTDALNPREQVRLAELEHEFEG